MHLEKLNPMTPALAGGVIGLGSQISSAAIDPENITTLLALKRIYSRVSVSPHVAALMAAHAGLGPQAVR